MKNYTPNGVVVDVVATVLTANELAVFVIGYLLLVFHIVFKNSIFCLVKKF